ncbi:MAG: peptidylprolyl isomerase, partial [Balneolaceae bacterium]|nr:peptidylprolyl isomerase [Balneolaceae bacterium]
MVRDSLLNGAAPEDMNERHSSKRNGAPIGGQLSWFTAGSTIQPFENAAYSLEPGEISMPVRSQFGYHLIILQDERERTPQRLVKHIFVRKNEDDTGSDKIQQAYQALEADSSWSEVLQNYTEDPSTRNRDGLLGWVGYGTRFPAQLIESAMDTNPDSAYSEPFEVSYGYHIMKIDSVRSFQNDEQKEEFIVDRLEQLGRLDPDRNDVFERIANESNLKINRKNFAGLTEQTRPTDEETESTSDKELIQFIGKTYTNDHFQEWLNRDTALDEVLESGDIITSYRNYIIENNLVEVTRRHFPEFAREVDHFLEGLIVFKVNDEYIWNPDAVDRSKLKAYYESYKDNYRKGKTYLYTEITAPSDSLIKIVDQQLEDDAEVNQLAENFENVTISEDSTSMPADPAYSTLQSLNVGEFSEPVSVHDREIIYVLDQIKPERMLSFEEAIEMVFSDYQPIHEENFLSKLKERYNLVTYPDNIP